MQANRRLKPEPAISMQDCKNKKGKLDITDTLRKMRFQLMMVAEEYSDLSQVSMIEPFCENSWPKSRD